MATQDDYVRTALRVPPDLHQKIHDAARENTRTFNAEIVARLERSFARHVPDSVPAMLERLPIDLVSQYGLHIYHEELDRAQTQLTKIETRVIKLHQDYQELPDDAPPGPRSRLKTSLAEAQRRGSVLQNQIEELQETISGIHIYRQVSGLPELRNVTRASVAIRMS